MNNRPVHTSFSEEDIQSFKPAMKVGLLATVNPEGLPHLTLINTLMASSPEQVIWGQFTEGLSKKFIRQNPKTGFTIMTLDRKMWRGKAAWTHTRQNGPELELFNEIPMFRYNAYFGIHTVYYMDLVEHSGKETLPMGAVASAIMKTTLARSVYRKKEAEKALGRLSQKLISKTGNPKFLSYIGSDGYPVIIPIFQAQALDTERIIFATSAYRNELEAIPAQATVAIFAMSLDMEDVLVRGIYQGVRRIAGINCGIVSTGWVYNAMPPKPQQIYPEVPLKAVEEFILD